MSEARDKLITDQKIDELRTYLNGVSEGEITDTEELVFLLASCWDELDGGSAQGMEGLKLYFRVEDLCWQPPLLSFRIERHGDTVQGSVYAEMQGWTVNVEKGSAVCAPSGRRVVGNRKPPMKVEPLAKEIVELISAGKDGVYFSVADGPGTPGPGGQVDNIVTGEFGNPQVVEEYDDIRLFGGG